LDLLSLENSAYTTRNHERVLFWFHYRTLFQRCQKQLHRERGEDTEIH